MGFAESFFKARAAKLATQRQKQQEKLTNLQMQEVIIKLGAAREQAKARKDFFRPDSSPTVNTPEGPPRPEEQGVLARITQGQTDVIERGLRAGMLDDIQKALGIKATSQFLGGQGAAQSGKPPGFSRRTTTFSPTSGSLSITDKEIGPTTKLEDGILVTLDPNSGEIIDRQLAGSPDLAKTKQDREFVPLSESQNIVTIDRKNFTVKPAPLGLQRGDLQSGDFVQVNAEQKKKLSAMRNALSMVDQLKILTDKVFTAQAGFLERGIAGGQNVWEQALQTNPAIVLYQSQLIGFSARFARALGEVGTLTDRDIGRTLGLFARVRNKLGLPDTAEVANLKMEALETMIKAQYNDVLGQKVFDIETPALDELIQNSVDDSLLDQGKRAVGVVERGTANAVEKKARSIMKKLGLERTD